jgi:hypothetical protein
MKKHLRFGRKSWLTLIALVFGLEFAHAQQFVLHAEWENTWYGLGFPMTNSTVNGYPSVTIQAQSASDQFVIEADNGFNRWKKFNNVDVNVPAPFAFYAGLGNVDNYLSSNTTAGKFYTVRMQNSGYASTNAVVMETDNAPVAFAATPAAPAVSQTPAAGAVNALSPVTVSVNLAGPKSPQERVYVRYTSTGWVSWNIVEATLQSGNTYQATIPGFASGTQVQYYAMTSTWDFSSIPPVNDPDLLTLFQETNGGSNYSYTIGNAAALAPITFRVNMTGTAVNPLGVYIAGTFNNWDPTINQLTALGGGVFEITISLDTTQTIEYKFCNGITLFNYETVPSACGISNGLGGFNRPLQVPNGAATLPTVCFGSCTNCPAPTLTAVTFRVNMGSIAPGTGGVHLAGSFNGFSRTATPLTLVGGTTYEVTVNLDTTTSIEYKFLKDTTNTGWEIVPSTCGTPDGFGGFNRQLAVPNSNTTLATVCFNECTNCLVPTFVPITFQVNMTGITIGSGGVHLAGTFNNFSRTATPMTLVGNNVYAATVSLDTTSIVYYKFLSDTSSTAWESVPPACGISYQTVLNRELAVPGSATTLPAVCFGTCTVCPPIATANVTFRVNMSQQTVGSNGVYLAGSFNGWSATATPMTLLGNGVYSATLALDTTATVQYKFLNGNTFTTQETVPAACGVPNAFNAYDRQLAVPQTDAQLPVVCFGQCSNCPTVGLVPVTFLVNMTGTTVGAGGVHLAGTFNNFSRTTTPMSNAGNNVYTATVSLDTTSTVYYKFLSDTTNAAWETVPPACGYAFQNILNRKLVIPEAAVTLPTVCFSSCSNCAGSNNVSVTFRVNMYNQTVSSQGLFLAGSFNNWSATATPMVFSANHIYEAIVSLDSTTTIEYKFLNGNTFANQETVPASCGVPDGFGGFNRSLVVPNANTQLAPVCFSSCANCYLPPAYNVTVRVDMSNSSTMGGLFVAGSYNNWSSTAIQMTVQSGMVYEATLAVDSGSTLKYRFRRGASIFETVPQACGVADSLGVFSRSLNVLSNNTVVPTVCFSACAACVPTGVAGVSNEEVPFVMPNPGKGTFSLQNISGYTQMEVLNLQGQRMVWENLNGKSNAQVSADDWSAGLYLIRLTGEGTTHTLRWSKQ